MYTENGKKKKYVEYDSSGNIILLFRLSPVPKSHPTSSFTPTQHSTTQSSIDVFLIHLLHFCVNQRSYCTMNQYHFENQYPSKQDAKRTAADIEANLFTAPWIVINNNATTNQTCSDEHKIEFMTVRQYITKNKPSLNQILKDDKKPRFYVGSKADVRRWRQSTNGMYRMKNLTPSCKNLKAKTKSSHNFNA